MAASKADAIGVAQLLMALVRTVPSARWLAYVAARSSSAAREALF
jgi:hypothetical protein